MKTKRPDRDGKHRGQFEKNKKKIYATQSICGICGRPVDMNIKYPDPLSPCIDHIIPVSRGGHPSDITNMQLAHRTCNRTKGDLMPGDRIGGHGKKSKGSSTSNAIVDDGKVINNRVLPQAMDWKTY